MSPFCATAPGSPFAGPAAPSWSSAFAPSYPQQQQDMLRHKLTAASDNHLGARRPGHTALQNQQHALAHSLSTDFDTAGASAASMAAAAGRPPLFPQYSATSLAPHLAPTAAHSMPASPLHAHPTASASQVLFPNSALSMSSVSASVNSVLSAPVGPLPSGALSSCEVETMNLGPDGRTHCGEGQEAPAQPQPQPQAQAQAQQATAGPSLLLATSPGTPPAMRRRVWSLTDYDISKRLYKGSTSAVYAASCLRSGMPVALKVYFLSRVPPNAMHMVAREITIHAELAHKHVLTLYGAFQEEGRLVLVQEFAARGDLYGIHRAMRRRMTEEQLTELVLAPFLDALSYLHTRGVCHRDIKPENILLTQDWRLLVADFGVSINLNQERAVTRAGTLDYMAPEVERCPIKYLPQDNKNNPSLAYTTAVDIWAVGVLAYELLVGFPPFVADNSAGGAAGQPQASGPDSAGAAFLAAHATRKTLSFPASVSETARDFISAALAERPEERPTAQALMQHAWLKKALQRRAAIVRPMSSPAAGSSPARCGVTRTPSRLNSSSVATAFAANSPPGPATAVNSAAVDSSGDVVMAV
ncbi:hypothetical protein HYH03_009776 [Edaphochlamys debaryana]|uniref:Protein kinase domain-containing protein n=1 Tax=Edaphochlamys debaryana TaxID=47281 RepID=A0A835XXW5_9CHLO|nr:hypothetical protein HYH03_009776 [Edaphochlamys debaryana]|eukprot:KAG2491819.1 hypothetical protein HYH03_009776 [Edaphochlamys debaryana]